MWHPDATCACQETDQQSHSPLAERLPERTTPERRYLQATWAVLLSFNRTVDALEEVFPLETNHSTVVRHVHAVVEQMMVAEGCQRAWETLPPLEGRITVGLDGVYVHAHDGDNRTAGWFEVIVGKRIPRDRPTKCFSFVQTHDAKPKRRLFDVLRAQGVQMNHFWVDKYTPADIAAVRIHSATSYGNSYSAGHSTTSSGMPYCCCICSSA